MKPQYLGTPRLLIGNGDSERAEARAVGRVIHGWQVELTLGAAPDYFYLTARSFVS